MQQFSVLLLCTCQKGNNGTTPQWQTEDTRNRACMYLIDVRVLQRAFPSRPNPGAPLLLWTFVDHHTRVLASSHWMLAKNNLG